MSLQTTTWQTVGPFFRIGLEKLFEHDVAGEGAAGERVRVRGRIVDGDGAPIPDALIEVWQANAEGKYAHPDDTQDKPLEPGFRGFARIPTDDDGVFQFTTVKPGSVPGADGNPQAPHLEVGVLMRGLLRGLVTRAYFPDEALNVCDQALNLIDADRRSTLILRRTAQPDLFTWQIAMQGKDETVFLDF